jgi:hypothetical protein
VRSRQAPSDGEIPEITERFADASANCIRASLGGAVDRFVADHADEVSRLDGATSDAFHASLETAVDDAAEQIATRLRDLDLWTSPRVRIEEEPTLEETSLLGWFLGEIGLRRIRPTNAPETRLDDANNRVWIVLLNAADGLDRVLTEYGFVPHHDPDPGGGHFGLQPTTLAALDPQGRLGRIWREYVGAFARLSRSGEPRR